LNVKLTALLTANDTDMLVMKLQCKDRFSAFAVSCHDLLELPLFDKAAPC